MARLTPQEYADKLVQRGNAAAQDYKNGVMRVQRSPGEAAAAAQDKMLTNVQAAVTSGRWASRVRSVSLSDWQQRTADVGSQRYGQGLTAARDKIAARAAQLLPAVDAAAAKARSMPSATKEQRIQRAVAFMSAMQKLK